MGVADAAARPRLRTRVGRHGAGEVVGLSGEQHVPVAGLGRQRGGAARPLGQHGGDGAAADGGRVVLEADDLQGGGGWLSRRGLAGGTV